MQFWMILNNPEMAVYCIENGLDRVFIDLEKLDKEKRQGHLDTWKSSHVEEDISLLRPLIPKGKLLVRLNKWNVNSEKEIELALKKGADFLMLPMITEFTEIESFSSAVSQQVPVIPLIETPQSLEMLSKIIKIKGIGETYIGLNDLTISLGLKFIFQPLMLNMIEKASEILNSEDMPWGFGGIARIKEGKIPAEILLGEHVRLGSSRIILSRTFHRNSQNLDQLLKNIDFPLEINKLKEAEKLWRNSNNSELLANLNKIKKLISNVVNS